MQERFDAVESELIVMNDETVKMCSYQLQLYTLCCAELNTARINCSILCSSTFCLLLA